MGQQTSNLSCERGCAAGQCIHYISSTYDMGDNRTPKDPESTTAETANNDDVIAYVNKHNNPFERLLNGALIKFGEGAIVEDISPCPDYALAHGHIVLAEWPILKDEHHEQVNATAEQVGALFKQFNGVWIGPVREIASDLRDIIIRLKTEQEAESAVLLFDREPLGTQGTLRLRVRRVFFSNIHFPTQLCEHLCHALDQRWDLFHEQDMDTAGDMDDLETFWESSGCNLSLLQRNMEVARGYAYGLVLQVDGRPLWSTNSDSRDRACIVTQKTGCLLVPQEEYHRFLYFGPEELSELIAGVAKNIFEDPGADVLPLHLREAEPEADSEEPSVHIPGVVVPTDNSSNGQPECQVCYCNAERPVTLSCNHAYCCDCFEQLCFEGAKRGKEVQCQGESGACEHIARLQEMHDNLTIDSLRDVLQESINVHVAQAPEMYGYCPTPDCAAIVARTTEPAQSTCSKCLKTSCTVCCQQHSIDVACEEHRRRTAEERASLEEYMQNSGVRPCPSCGTGIEKDYGCHHMECIVCGTHICWFCMATFGTSNETYAHMTASHQAHGIAAEMGVEYVDDE